MLRGLDVRLLQLGLSEAGCNGVADATFAAWKATSISGETATFE